MRAVLRLERRATYEDYLAVEEASDHRYELIEGVVVAMPSASCEHNAIAGRLAVLFGSLTEAPCRYFTPDQRFWIAAQARARYADGSIICGKPEHPRHDGQATVNPSVVVEVMSPSNEGDDEGDKRLDFQTLTSLRAYVLAAQDQRRIRVYRRDQSGRWPAEPEVYGAGDTFSLPTLRRAIAVDEVYETVLDDEGRSLLR